MNDKVLLIATNGENLGLKTIAEAQEIATSQGLVLETVSHNTSPQVMKIVEVVWTKTKRQPK